MKHPADYISDWWDRLRFREEELFQNDDLAILAFIHRLRKDRTISVVVARSAAFPTVTYSAYEVDDVSPDAYAQLLRIIEGGPTAAELIVWLWHQGVYKPVEEWVAP